MPQLDPATGPQTTTPIEVHLPGPDPGIEITTYRSTVDGALVVVIDTCALSPEHVLRVEVHDGPVFSGAVFSAHPDLGDHDLAQLAPYLSELWAACTRAAGAPAGLRPRDAVRALTGYLGRDQPDRGQEPEGRDRHSLVGPAALVRWLDIGSTEQAFALPRTLRSILADGYTPEQIDDVLGLVSRSAGVRVVCGWDYRDRFGYGGDSEFYLLATHGLYHLSGDLWSWLNDPPGTAAAHPGSPRSWFGAPALGIELTATDTQQHNYVRRRR